MERLRNSCRIIHREYRKTVEWRSPLTGLYLMAVNSAFWVGVIYFDARIQEAILATSSACIFAWDILLSSSNDRSIITHILMWPFQSIFRTFSVGGGLYSIHLLRVEEIRIACYLSYTTLKKGAMTKVGFKKGDRIEDLEDEQCYEIISLVEQFPCLWNITNARYLDKSNHVKVFNTIEKTTRLTAREKGYNCSRIWKELVKKYTAERSRQNKVPSGSSSAAIQSRFKFFDTMRFLDVNSIEKQGEMLTTAPSFSAKTNFDKKANFEVIGLSDSAESSGEEECKTPTTKLRKMKTETPSFKRKYPIISDDETEIELLKVVKKCAEKLDTPSGNNTVFNRHSDITAIVIEALDVVGGLEAIELKLAIGKLCTDAKKKKEGNSDVLGLETDPFLFS